MTEVEGEKVGGNEGGGSAQQHNHYFRYNETKWRDGGLLSGIISLDHNRKDAAHEAE